MNENPEGTQNPLNPNLNSGQMNANQPDSSVQMNGGGAQFPQGMSADQSESPAPMGEGNTQFFQNDNQIDKESYEIVGEKTVTVDSLDPTGRKMEKVVPVIAEKTKKKKGPLIALISAFAVLIVAAIVAVVVMNMMNKPDPVADAMAKLMSGDLPKNMVVDGNINVLFNSTGTPITRLNIDLDSDLIVGSSVNTSSAVVTITTRNNGDYSLEFDEVYATDGDIYFRLDGATSVLEDSGLLELLLTGQEKGSQYCDDEGYCAEAETNCTDAETNCEEAVMLESEVVGVESESSVDDNDVVVEGDYSATYSILNTEMLNSIIDVIETVDGNWLRFSTDLLTQPAESYLADTPASCVVNLVSDLNKASNSTGLLYSKYPFIGSTTEGVLVSGISGPVYKVTLNGKNFANFVNSIDNPDLKSDLYGCMNWDTHAAISEEDVAEAMGKLPDFFVELDGNKNFTRFYFETELNNGAISMVTNLSFSYPQNVNISEPVEYTDFSEFIEKIMSGFYDMPVEEVEVEEGAVEAE